MNPARTPEGLETREQLSGHLRLSVKQCRKEGNNLVSELVRELENTFEQELAFLFNQLYKQAFWKITGRSDDQSATFAL